MPGSSIGPKEWKSILDDFQQSGLSKADYCKNKGLSISTFSRWKKKLIDEKSSSEKKTAKRSTKANTQASTKANTQAKNKTGVSNSISMDETGIQGSLVATLPNGVVINYNCGDKELLLAALSALSEI